MLASNRFSNAYFTSTTWTACVAEGTTREQVLDPTFWGGVMGTGKDVKKFDIINVISDDGSFDIQLRVQAVAGSALMVTERFSSQPAATPAKKAAARIATGKARTEFTREDKWRVVSESGEVVLKNFETAEEAETALAEHLKLARAA